MTAILPHRDADKATSSLLTVPRKPSFDGGDGAAGAASSGSPPTSGQGTHDTANGAAPHSDHTSHRPANEKQSMTKRLTRMFSARDTNKTGSGSESGGTKSPPHATTPVPGEPSTAPTSRHAPPSHQQSSLEKIPIMPKPKEKPKEPQWPAQRYILVPDVPGGHEHHLKSAKRQEKLSDMLRDMLIGKKKPMEAHEGEQQLSLMSSWVDQLKREREALASTDKKGGPNTTATLVEKYGKCQEIVGRGAFGIVRISHKRKEGDNEQLFAVKEFRRRPDESEKRYSKRLTSEFCISSSLRHPNVIHTLDLLQDSKGDYCEVMEFCAGGDLYTLVLAAGKLEVAEADCYFKQLMRGVEYMHEMGVAHRDLKPENLLLTTHGALKITDFGNGECFRMAWETDAHMVSGLCGSAPYIAPEEYVDKEFDARAVDVWATGVIYMAMRTGRHLWRVARKDEDEFYERYLEGRRDEEGYGPIESLARARCRNVIYSILDPNPSRRITASQVLKSEWGREVKLCKAGEEGI
ncbi:serine/threonine-protein kinase HAL4/sat4 [Pseudogymnoascus destructans]|uniref:non-specific serine/threonine protein kinase n=2 Tax=Pseudogymnoascus destructans TaxID=655981 RepID=L8GAZ6_PSED2|nr:serine/threonine-protein kinase HAL4/sat4 [Pseudogymnoascus destructans]ELR10390.1 HAL protein kinase [Pseudogymnoascus destructans 20631-21]OAF63094.1 serine/threonine-protein kinase HAL4/sat4 [Pseudogymnoascus destructans]